MRGTSALPTGGGSSQPTSYSCYAEGVPCCDTLAADSAWQRQPQAPSCLFVAEYLHERSALVRS